MPTSSGSLQSVLAFDDLEQVTVVVPVVLELRASFEYNLLIGGGHGVRYSRVGT